MVLPKEFTDVLAGVELLCVSAESDDISIFRVLELLKPIRSSPLRYAFPFICSYITACNAFVDDFIEVLMKYQNIARDSYKELYGGALYFIVNMVDAENGSRDEILRAVMFLTGEKNNMIFVLFPKTGQTSRNRFELRHEAIPIHYVKQLLIGISSRANFQCASVFHTGNAWAQLTDPVYLNALDNIIFKYGPMLLTNHMVAFDPQICRQDAINFRSRAEMKYRVGVYVANHVKYKPGSDGYDETAAHFATIK